MTEFNEISDYYLSVFYLSLRSVLCSSSSSITKKEESESEMVMKILLVCSPTFRFVVGNSIEFWCKYTNKSMSESYISSQYACVYVSERERERDRIRVYKEDINVLHLFYIRMYCVCACVCGSM